MFSTIVAGTDGSKNAERALQVTADLAKRYPGTSVHVVMAHHPLTAADIQSIAAELPEEMRPLLHPHMEADTVLAEAKSLFHSVGVEAEVHEIDADPTDALLGVAERMNADLMVVGSRGEGVAKRALHGSVSTKVMHHAPCAVLVVKADEHARAVQ